MTSLVTFITPPCKGGGRGRVLSRCGAIECIRNDSNHSVRVSQHVVVPEPQDSEPRSLQSIGSQLIFDTVTRMLAAVDLDHQTGLRAGKVHDESSDAMLSAELAPVDLASPQSLPHDPLRARFVATKNPRKVGRRLTVTKSWQADPLPPLPLAGGGRQAHVVRAADAFHRSTAKSCICLVAIL